MSAQDDRKTVHVRCQADVPETWAPNTNYVMHAPVKAYGHVAVPPIEVSAQDELPPHILIQEGPDGWPQCVVGVVGLDEWIQFEREEDAEEYAWKMVGGREEYTTMRAAVEQLESAKGAVLQAAFDHEGIEGESPSEAIVLLSSELRAAVGRCAELETEVSHLSTVAEYEHAESSAAISDLADERDKAEAALASMTAGYETAHRAHADAVGEKHEHKRRADKAEALAIQWEADEQITRGLLEEKLDAAITERNALEADIGKTDQAAEKLLEERDEARAALAEMTEKYTEADAMLNEMEPG